MWQPSMFFQYTLLPYTYLYLIAEVYCAINPMILHTPSYYCFCRLNLPLSDQVKGFWSCKTKKADGRIPVEKQFTF